MQSDVQNVRAQSQNASQNVDVIAQNQNEYSLCACGPDLQNTWMQNAQNCGERQNMETKS